jgi:hypothetical protein
MSRNYETLRRLNMQRDKSDSVHIETVQSVSLVNMFDYAREIASGKAEPDVAKADELLTTLQQNLQHAADTALENAIATHLDDAVQMALERINESLRTNAEQVAWVDEPHGRTEEELDSYRSTAEEIARRLNLLMRGAQRNLSEMQEFVEQVTHQLQTQLQDGLNETVGGALQGFEDSVARVSESQFANFTLGTQAAWQEALLQLDARVAATRRLSQNAPNVPSPDQIEILLRSIKEETLDCVETRLQEMSRHWEEQQDLQRNHLTRIEQKLDELSRRSLPDAGDAGKPATQVARGLESQFYTRLEESVGRAAQNFESAAARTSDRHLVRLMDEKKRLAGEASLEIEAGVAEARSHLQKAANVTLDEFRRRVEVQIDLEISEATQRMKSSLASLDAEHRAACDVRRHAIESDVARTAEQSTQEFRTGMKAFLYSCLVAAVSAVDEHAQTTLIGLGKNAVGLPHDLMPPSKPSG